MNAKAVPHAGGAPIATLHRVNIGVFDFSPGSTDSPTNYSARLSKVQQQQQPLASPPPTHLPALSSPSDPMPSFRRPRRNTIDAAHASLAAARQLTSVPSAATAAAELGSKQRQSRGPRDDAAPSAARAQLLALELMLDSHLLELGSRALRVHAERGVETGVGARETAPPLPISAAHALAQLEGLRSSMALVVSSVNAAVAELDRARSVGSQPSAAADGLQIPAVATTPHSSTSFSDSGAGISRLLHKAAACLAAAADSSPLGPAALAAAAAPGAEAFGGLTPPLSCWGDDHSLPPSPLHRRSTSTGRHRGASNAGSSLAPSSAAPRGSPPLPSIGVSVSVSASQAQYRLKLQHLDIGSGAAAYAGGHLMLEPGAPGSPAHRAHVVSGLHSPTTPYRHAPITPPLLPLLLHSVSLAYPASPAHPAAPSESRADVGPLTLVPSAAAADPGEATAAEEQCPTAPGTGPAGPERASERHKSTGSARRSGRDAGGSGRTTVVADAAELSLLRPPGGMQGADGAAAAQPGSLSSDNTRRSGSFADYGEAGVYGEHSHRSDTLGSAAAAMLYGRAGVGGPGPSCARLLLPADSSSELSGSQLDFRCEGIMIDTPQGGQCPLAKTASIRLTSDTGAAGAATRAVSTGDASPLAATRSLGALALGSASGLLVQAGSVGGLGPGRPGSGGTGRPQQPAEAAPSFLPEGARARPVLMLAHPRHPAHPEPEPADSEEAAGAVFAVGRRCVTPAAPGAVAGGWGRALAVPASPSGRPQPFPDGLFSGAGSTAAAAASSPASSGGPAARFDPEPPLTPVTTPLASGSPAAALHSRGAFILPSAAGSPASGPGGGGSGCGSPPSRPSSHRASDVPAGGAERESPSSAGGVRGRPEGAPPVQLHVNSSSSAAAVMAGMGASPASSHHAGGGSSSSGSAALSSLGSADDNDFREFEGSARGGVRPGGGAFPLMSSRLAGIAIVRIANPLSGPGSPIASHDAPAAGVPAAEARVPWGPPLFAIPVGAAAATLALRLGGGEAADDARGDADSALEEEEEEEEGDLEVPPGEAAAGSSHSNASSSRRVSSVPVPRLGLAPLSGAAGVAESASVFSYSTGDLHRDLPLRSAPHLVAIPPLREDPAAPKLPQPSVPRIVGMARGGSGGVGGARSSAAGSAGSPSAPHQPAGNKADYMEEFNSHAADWSLSWREFARTQHSRTANK